jgi:glutamate-ammonia-ligase adenylyltransferase
MTRNAPSAASVHSPDLAEHSRFATRIRRRYAAELSLLPPGLPTAPVMRDVAQALRTRGLDTSAMLRVLRQLVMERLLTLDVNRLISLQDVTHTMTALAEVVLDVATQEALHVLDETHGAPLMDKGQRAQLWVLGMGKLGARELNVSSDIDLIYVYDQDGETAGNAQGRAKISNHEYFAKAVRHIYGLVGDTTEHGFVFRVDLALRPNGNSGPAAVSLGALEEYFHVQGREWERFAWLKSRVVAPASAVQDRSAMPLRGIVVPFVFRRYLDYNVFNALRVLHKQIREHASKRSAGHPERSHDVKLSRGGIREIEFTVQVLQVVRGGQFPELRTRPTLDALQRLVQANLMPADTAQAMAQAYVFLREVEHRIQYLDDQQTHVLPTRDDDLNWIAKSLGFDNCCDFLSQFDAHRELVAQEFDILLGGDDPDCKGCDKTKQVIPDLAAVAAGLPDALRERVAAWASNPRVLRLREESRQRLDRLLGRTGLWLKEGRVGEEAALRFTDWLEPLLRRDVYLALLLERPAVHERLLRLLGLAKWPARYLLQHPGVIDELAGHNMLTERFDAAAFEQDLAQRRKALRDSGDGDDEALLNLLRRAHHAEVFRTLARDVEGVLTVEQVADDLSALAEAVLRTTTAWCWDTLKKKHRESAQFAVIAYGKLGGKELGYGSDLDIVFVFDDEHDQAAEVYGALVRKLINWLTVKTGEGDLYEIDTALRPNGSSGLLITTFEAYANYQQQRGSNTAWTWEHQAMTRARCVLGGVDLQAKFEAVREAVICSPREHTALREEIMTMRERVRQAHPCVPELFDVKHSAGGMVDAEFAVQYLVLAHACAHPELRGNLGNIALLIAAEKVGLLPAGVGEAAANAYRELRRVQHRARLDEAPTQVPMDQLSTERAAVLQVWHAVFGH